MMESPPDPQPMAEARVETNSQPPPPPGPPPLPPPLPPQLPMPVLPLDYCRAIDRHIGWVVVARCRTMGQWHATRQALTASNIVAMMGDGANVAPGQEASEVGGIELLVSREELPLASVIVEAHRSGRLWCPYCGSTSVRMLPVAWYWYILAVLFMNMPPVWPPSKICDACGKKWG